MYSVICALRTEEQLVEVAQTKMISIVQLRKVLLPHHSVPVHTSHQLQPAIQKLNHPYSPDQLPQITSRFKNLDGFIEISMWMPVFK